MDETNTRYSCSQEETKDIGDIVNDQDRANAFIGRLTGKALNDPILAGLRRLAKHRNSTQPIPSQEGDDVLQPGGLTAGQTRRRDAEAQRTHVPDPVLAALQRAHKHRGGR